MVEVFVVIERTTWQRGVALLFLIAAVALFYALSAPGDELVPAGGQLVFSNQYMPEIGRSDAAEEAGAGIQSELEPEAAEEDEAVPVWAAPATTREGRASAFDRFRIARLQERARRIESLERLLAEQTLEGAARQRAQEELVTLIGAAELEERAEGLLVARGLYDAVVVITGRSAEVIVPEQLTRDQAAQVGSVVARIAGLSLDNVVIVDGAPVD